MENKWIYVAYAAAWISVGVAVVLGFKYTGNLLCISGFLFAPKHLYFDIGEDDEYDK